MLKYKNSCQAIISFFNLIKLNQPHPPTSKKQLIRRQHQLHLVSWLKPNESGTNNIRKVYFGKGGLFFTFMLKKIVKIHHLTYITILLSIFYKNKCLIKKVSKKGN